METCADCGLPTAHHSERCKPCKDLQKRDITVSPLDESDLELVLAWRSNPRIYKHFRNQTEPLEWDQHVEWFASRAPDRHDFIIHFDGRRVGVVSLDVADKVSVYLGDFSAHGYGIATAVVDWITARFENRTPIYAEIHRENRASKRLFDRCGFEFDEQDGEWLRYTYER